MVKNLDVPKDNKDVRSTVTIPVNGVSVEGVLRIPHNPRGIVLFAHGSGSGRHSPRNRLVAEVMNEAGLATLLMDLLTVEEESKDEYSGYLRFNIEFLAGRLIDVTDWLKTHSSTAGLNIGYFGASTGAGAAL